MKGTWEFYPNLGKILTTHVTLQIIHCEAEREFSKLSVKSKFWLNMLERLNYPPALCKKIFHIIFVWSSDQSVQTKNVGKKYYRGTSGSLWKYVIFLGFMILVFLSFIQFLICCDFLILRKIIFCVYLEFYVLSLTRATKFHKLQGPKPGSTPVPIKQERKLFDWDSFFLLFYPWVQLYLTYPLEGSIIIFLNLVQLNMLWFWGEKAKGTYDQKCFLSERLLGGGE